MARFEFRALAASVSLIVTISACSQQQSNNEAAALAAKQAQVAERGRSVMPFDMSRTMHHFRKLPSGGVQQVLSMDGDPSQVRLIRSHLRMETDRFQRGDFSEPSSIHGMNMPGLKELAAGSRGFQVSYSDIPAGGQISFTSDDPKLRAAIHSWFDAQVREHGHHAMAS